MVWLMLSVCALIFAIDLTVGTSVVPLRDVARPGKAVTILLFTPLLIFVAIAMLRQLPFSESRFAASMRALVCVGFFLVLNF